MTADTTADDRYPTTGPDEQRYDSYRCTQTDDGAVLLFHADNDAEWIRAAESCSLKGWR